MKNNRKTNQFNKKAELKLKNNIPLDYVYTFILNLNMANSIWVLYLAYCGMSLMQIGLLEGVYHAAGILFEIPSGAIADLLGRRKSMLAGRILMTISCIIMLCAHSFSLFALGFLLQALSANFNSGSEEALVYDSMVLLGVEDSYVRVSSRLNLIIEVSQAIATVAGGVLAEYSYVWCYGACIVITLLSLIPALFMTEPPVADLRKNTNEAETILPCNTVLAADAQTEHLKNASTPMVCSTASVHDASASKTSVMDTVKYHFRTSFSILKSDRRILHIIGYYSGIFALYTLLFFYSQQYFYEMGLNKIQISLIMLLSGVFSCLGALASDKLYHPAKDSGRLAFSVRIIAIVIAVCVGCFVLDNLIVSITAFTIAGFLNSVLYPIQSDSLNVLIPSAQRATLISINSMFFSVAMILIFPVAGAFADTLGLTAVFGGLGIMGLALIQLYHFLFKSQFLNPSER
ncbi:MAG: MFS transporter [Lachnospiraceae bacterium]|nr:MFS transporter [Lachnospiraceae bacterium]